MDQQNKSKSFKAEWPALSLLGFGLALLGFLVAIEREEWFHIRPISSSAQAMSLSSSKSASAIP